VPDDVKYLAGRENPIGLRQTILFLHRKHNPGFADLDDCNFGIPPRQTLGVCGYVRTLAFGVAQKV